MATDGIGVAVKRKEDHRFITGRGAPTAGAAIGFNTYCATMSFHAD